MPIKAPIQPKAKVAPVVPTSGQKLSLPVPNIALSPAAKAAMGSPDKIAKANALTQKITKYQAELARLLAAQKKFAAQEKSAQTQLKKIGGIDEQTLKYFSYIQKHCGQFLSDLQGSKKFLFRGVSGRNLPSIFVGHPRENRKPMSSSADAQRLADKYLSLMGFKALRSNSIFTTSAFYQADGFGKVYAIFPKNGFNFTWSSVYDDLIISLYDLQSDGDDSEEQEHIYDDLDAVLDFLSDIPFNKSNLEYHLTDFFDDTNAVAKKKALEVIKNPDFKAFVKAYHYWDSNVSYESSLRELYTRSADVAKAYFSTKKSSPIFASQIANQLIGSYENKRLTKLLADADKHLATMAPKKMSPAEQEKEKARRVIKNFGFKNTDLSAALRSGHEIFVNGDYIAVDYSIYKNQLTKFFLSKNN